MLEGGHGVQVSGEAYMYLSPVGNAHLEDQEDTTSVYKLPHTKFHEGRVCDGMDGDGGDLGCVRIEEPPTVANYDPSR